MSDQDNPIERAVELLVYTPIGLAMFAKDTVPTFLKMFVARGEAELKERRRTAGNQASQYKTIGRMAVKYGGPEAKRQAGAAAETLRRRAEETIAGIASATSTPALPSAGRPAEAPTRADGSPPGDERPRQRSGGGPAHPGLRPALGDAGDRASRRARAARAVGRRGLRDGAPGPHDDPRSHRPARWLTRRCGP